MTHDAVTPENVLSALLQHNGDQVPFVCTGEQSSPLSSTCANNNFCVTLVIGDSLFADILENIVGLISSDVPSRTTFASMQLKDLEEEDDKPSPFIAPTATERQQQLARVYAVALRKIAGTCERALALERAGQSSQSSSSLTLTIALNKLSRLIKDALHVKAQHVVQEMVSAHTCVLFFFPLTQKCPIFRWNSHSICGRN